MSKKNYDRLKNYNGHFDHFVVLVLKIERECLECFFFLRQRHFEKEERLQIFVFVFENGIAVLEQSVDWVCLIK